MNDVADSRNRKIVGFIPDALQGPKDTQVFITAQLTDEFLVIKNVFDVLKYMATQLPSPLPLRRTAFSASSVLLTVVFEVNSRPQIHVGRSAPSLDPEKDIQEILSVLESHGIKGEVRS